MTRVRLRFALPLVILALISVAVIAPHANVQNEQTGQPWDAGTMAVGEHASSTLTLNNDCQRTHSFSVTKTNADFLDLQFNSPVTVPGHKSVTEPVRFHTEGMHPGDYTGTVVVTCLDCKENPPCTQDHKYLRPHLNVIQPAGVQTATPLSNTNDFCHQDCSDILKRYNNLQAQIKIQTQKVSAADSERKAANDKFVQATSAAEGATQAALTNLDIKKAEQLQKTAQTAQVNLQKAQDALTASSQNLASEIEKGKSMSAEASALYQQYMNCISAIGVCKQEGPPKSCTPGNPCTDGWTGCGPGQVCKPPELCTSEHPCTGGTAVSGPPQTQGQAKSPCTQSKEDCTKLRLIAEQKEAEAKAAQATADKAAAEATKQEAAARGFTGKDSRDILARQEVARSARENANKMQQSADQAKADAAAARKLADECMKHENAECSGVTGQTTDGGGGHPGTVAKPPCPPTEDCEKLRLAWQEAERQSAIAQALADQAARNQQWNNSSADYLDSVAASDDDFANGQTRRAGEMREIAGMAKGLGAKDREFAAQYPPGSKDRAAWEHAADEEDKDVVNWNRWADEAEATEMQYHKKAAAERAEAAQLRGASNTAQAEADAAKAKAAAAKKAYEDCLERAKHAKDDCDKHPTTGGNPGTTGRGPAGGTPPPTGGNPPPTGGGNPPPTGGGGGTTTGRGPKPPDTPVPTGGNPGTTSTPKKKGKRCEWRFFEIDFGPYTMDSKEQSDRLKKIREQLQKFLEKAAPNAAKGVDAILKGFTITRIAQNVYITYILVEIDLDTGAETVIDSKTITLEDKDAIDFWGNVESAEARGARAATIARLKPQGGCPTGR